MIQKFFDKKSTGSGVPTLGKKHAIRCMPNQQLANELHQPIIRKSERRKVHFLFRDNILGVDLADM